MASPELWASARKTAVGMCSLAAQERKDDMKQLLKMYLIEQHMAGMTEGVAMMHLVNALVSANIHVARTQGDPAEVFSDLAEMLAVL